MFNFKVSALVVVYPVYFLFFVVFTSKLTTNRLLYKVFYKTL